MTRKSWITYCIAPPPSVENPWSWMKAGWEEETFITLRSWLAYVRKRNPHFMFKSERTGEGHVHIKTCLRPELIRKEANR